MPTRKQPGTPNNSTSLLDIHRQNIASKNENKISKKVSNILNQYSQCTDRELEDLYISRYQECESYKWSWIYGHASEWPANEALLKICEEQRKRKNERYYKERYWEWIITAVTGRINSILKKIRWEDKNL